MNLISRTGKELCAISIAWLFLVSAVCATTPEIRNAWTVTQWLCSHVFNGPGATLAICENGFFALRLENSKKEIQNISGLWQLAPDGIQLTLLNLQDGRLQLSVGKEAIHAMLPNLGPTTLFPAPFKPLDFKIVGMVHQTPNGLILEDASSGIAFPIPDTSFAKPDKFATALLNITTGGPKIIRILSDSRQVPRFWVHPPANSDLATFKEKVTHRYWLLPPTSGHAQAALRLDNPDQHNTGTFEISGPGLRLDGQFTLNEDKLTLTAERAKVRNLKILGASRISDAFLRQHTWCLSSRGLELESDGQRVLLLPYAP